MLENIAHKAEGFAARRLTPAVPTFDPEAAIRRLDGDEELFAMLVSMFHQDCDALLEELALGIEHDDLARVERAAHTLKGLAANLEATSARDAALAIEQLAQAGNLDGAAPAAAQLRQELQSLRRALVHWNAAYSA